MAHCHSFEITVSCMGPVDLQNRIQDDKYDFQRRNIVKRWRNNNRGFIHYKNLTLCDHNFIDCYELLLQLGRIRKTFYR